MAGICKVILVGNIGKDPEVRQTANGKTVCNFSVAVSNRKNGQDQTVWHRVTCYDKLAEIAGQYGKKGRQVFVEGKLNYSTYTDRQGVEKSSTDIIAQEIQFMGRAEQQETKEPVKADDEELPF